MRSNLCPRRDLMFRILHPCQAGGARSGVNDRRGQVFRIAESRKLTVEEPCGREGCLRLVFATMGKVSAHTPCSQAVEFAPLILAKGGAKWTVKLRRRGAEGVI